MTSRVLDYAEWHLVPEYMDDVLKTMRPGTSRVCVIEHEGEIIARWLLYPVLMAEDIWIAPQYRQRVSVGRKLWRLMQRAATELGFSRVVSAVVDDTSRALLTNRGLKGEALPLLVTYPVRGVE